MSYVVHSLVSSYEKQESFEQHEHYYLPLLGLLGMKSFDDDTGLVDEGSNDVGSNLSLQMTGLVSRTVPPEIALEIEGTCYVGVQNVIGDPVDFCLDRMLEVAVGEQNWGWVLNAMNYELAIAAGDESFVGQVQSCCHLRIRRNY